MTIGERLRSAREAIPASLYQASRETKIRVDFLEHLEKDNFRFMTGSTYIKGMVRAYAKWVGLDADAIAGDFDKLNPAPRAPKITEIAREPAQAAPRSRTPHWVVAGAVGAAILLVFSLVGVMKPLTTVAPPPSTPRTAQSPDITAAIAPTAPVDKVVLTVSITGDKSWVRVLSEGQEPATFEGTLFNGMQRVFESKNAIRITIGNLGAVQININGRELGSPGGIGQAGTFLFTPDSTTFARG